MEARDLGVGSELLEGGAQIGARRRLHLLGQRLDELVVGLYPLRRKEVRRADQVGEHVAQRA